MISYMCLFLYFSLSTSSQCAASTPLKEGENARHALDLGLESTLGSSDNKNLQNVPLELASAFQQPVGKSSEFYSEELLVRPLPDGKLLAVFQFTHKLQPNGHHHHQQFPKSVDQIVRHHGVRKMEMSLTHGRWDHRRWGRSFLTGLTQGKPPGVELWAWLDAPPESLDSAWRNLTNALSGLFCASLNFLESSASVASPELFFRPDLKAGEAGGMRYGALPREAVCTENLTPWLKLLPCRDHAGLASLLQRSTIFSGPFHSLQLSVKGASAPEPGDTSLPRAIELRQTLSFVVELQRGGTKRRDRRGGAPGGTQGGRKQWQADWSVASVFGAPPSSNCPLADATHVYLELEYPLLQAVAWPDGQPVDPVENTAFSVKGKLSAVLEKRRGGAAAWHSLASLKESVILQFVVSSDPATSQGIGMEWKKPITWALQTVPFTVERFITGHGNERGGICLLLRAGEKHRRPPTSKPVEPQSQDLVDVMAFEEQGWNTFAEKSEEMPVAVTGEEVEVLLLIPWFARVYLHTLALSFDGLPVALWNAATWTSLRPAQDRVRPAVLELQLLIPHNMTTAMLTVQFDKGYLFLDEHPPDASRGLDLPPALVSFPGAATAVKIAPASLGSAISLSNQPLLQLMEEPGPMCAYAAPLVLPLPLPDFSMPYNVVTLTCTILALMLGSLLNVLRRRPGEEARSKMQVVAGSNLALKSTLGRFRKSGKSFRILVAVSLITVVAVYMS